MAKTLGTLFVCLLWSCFAWAQPTLRWSRGYSSTEEDQWLGRAPQITRVTRYDHAGRVVSKGTYKDDEYFPLEFWKYDAQGREVLSWAIDITGKPLHAMRKTYNAQGQLAQEYYGSDTMHLKLGKEYTYQKGRRIQSKSVGEFVSWQPVHRWKYESNPTRITESVCYDSLGQNCTVSSVKTLDPKSQLWTMTFGDLPYQGGRYTCLDSACEKYLTYESRTEGNKLFQRTVRTYDANAHPLHAEMLDSVNGCRQFQDWKYDRWGNLVEERWEVRRFNSGHLTQKHVLDEAGRPVAIYAYDNAGTENLAIRKRYDAAGHCTDQREYGGTDHVVRHQSWQYAAAQRCVAQEDSNEYVDRTILRYDDRGKLIYKRVVRAVTNVDARFKYANGPMIWIDRAQSTDHKKPPLSNPNPPQPKPEIIGYDTTEFAYEYDAFDSLAAVYAIGFHHQVPLPLNEDMMPDFSLQVGSRGWARSPHFQADTLMRHQNGDTLFLHLQDKYPPDDLDRRCHVRKVWLFRGVPIQIEEYDPKGRKLLFWRDADYAHATRIPVKEVYSSDDAKHEPHHTLRVLLQTFRTTLSGDTIFRDETFSSSGSMTTSRLGYVAGRLVLDQHAQGYVQTYTYDPQGKLILRTSGVAGQLNRTHVRYDAQGRLVGERTFGLGGSLVSGMDYTYPDPKTKLVHTLPADHVIQIHYQLEYWE